MTPRDDQITGAGFVVSYVDDFEAAHQFYSRVLGLRETCKTCGEECFFQVGDQRFGLFLVGGCKKRKQDPKAAQVSFTLKVQSASAMFKRLKKADVPIVQEAPQDMGAGDFWFQFFDPAGNMLQVVGRL